MRHLAFGMVMNIEIKSVKRRIQLKQIAIIIINSLINNIKNIQQQLAIIIFDFSRATK